MRPSFPLTVLSGPDARASVAATVEWFVLFCASDRAG